MLWNVVWFLKIIYGGTDINDENVDVYMDGVGTRLGRFHRYDVKEAKFGENESKVAKISFVRNAEDYVGNMYVFEFANFIFGKRKNSSIDYRMDIQKVLESININMDYEEQKEDEYKELARNPLLDTEIELNDVKSETGEFLGRWVKMNLTKEQAKAITQEQFKEYMNQRVLDSYESVKIKWACIIFEDGTGLHFIPGTAIANYGKIDSEGAIIEQLGIAMVKEDGTYRYEAF